MADHVVETKNTFVNIAQTEGKEVAVTMSCPTVLRHPQDTMYPPTPEAIDLMPPTVPTPEIPWPHEGGPDSARGPPSNSEPFPVLDNMFKSENGLNTNAATFIPGGATDFNNDGETHEPIINGRSVLAAPIQVHPIQQQRLEQPPIDWTRMDREIDSYDASIVNALKAAFKEMLYGHPGVAIMVSLTEPPARFHLALRLDPSTSLEELTFRLATPAEYPKSINVVEATMTGPTWARIAVMYADNPDDVCWEWYKSGFCRNEKKCRWPHIPVTIVDISADHYPIDKGPPAEVGKKGKGSSGDDASAWQPQYSAADPAAKGGKGKGKSGFSKGKPQDQAPPNEKGHPLSTGANGKDQPHGANGKDQPYLQKGIPRSTGANGKDQPYLQKGVPQSAGADGKDQAYGANGKDQPYPYKGNAGKPSASETSSEKLKGKGEQSAISQSLYDIWGSPRKTVTSPEKSTKKTPIVVKPNSPSWPTLTPSAKAQPSPPSKGNAKNGGKDGGKNGGKHGSNIGGKDGGKNGKDGKQAKLSPSSAEGPADNGEGTYKVKNGDSKAGHSGKANGQGKGAKTGRMQWQTKPK
jgi:hypothetical protein